MGMKISEMITDRYKLRIPPTVYYDLLSDVQEAEDEQEPFRPMVEIDLDYVIKQKYIEREVLDKIRAEVESINVWGMRYNPDIDKDRKPQIVQKVKEHFIEILDKYKAETEET